MGRSHHPSRAWDTSMDGSLCTSSLQVLDFIRLCHSGLKTPELTEAWPTQCENDYCEFSCLKGQISHGCDKNALRESCVTDLHERLSESFSPDLLSDLGQWRSILTTIHQITRLFKLTVFASIARMPTRSTSFIAATMCFFKGAHTHIAKTKACILF